jgi:hypothetical protein
MRVSLAAGARAEGVTRQWVHEMVTDGRLSRGADGKIDLDELRRLRADGLDPSRGNHKGGGPVLATFQRARAAREAYQAQLAKLDLDERSGTLISKADVERDARSLAAALVGLLTAVPDRIASEFGVDDDHRFRLRIALRNEMDRVRAELVRKIGGA